MKSITNLQRSSLVKIKMWSLQCTTFSSKSGSRRQVSYFKKTESKENLKFWNSQIAKQLSDKFFLKKMIMIMGYYLLLKKNFVLRIEDFL